MKVESAANETLGTTREVLGQMTSQIVGATTQLESQLSGATTRYLTTTTDQLRSDTQELTEARNAVSRMQADLLRALDGFGQAEEMAAERVGVLAATLAHVQTQGTQEITGSMNDLNRSVVSLTTEFSRSLALLAESVDRLDSAIVANQSMTQSQVHEMTQVRDALELLASRNFGQVAGSRS